MGSSVVAFALLALVAILVMTWPSSGRGRPFPRRKDRGPDHPYRKAPKRDSS